MILSLVLEGASSSFLQIQDTSRKECHWLGETSLTNRPQKKPSCGSQGGVWKCCSKLGSTQTRSHPTDVVKLRSMITSALPDAWLFRVRTWIPQVLPWKTLEFFHTNSTSQTMYTIHAYLRICGVAFSPAHGWGREPPVHYIHWHLSSTCTIELSSLMVWANTLLSASSLLRDLSFGWGCPIHCRGASSFLSSLRVSHSLSGSILLPLLVGGVPFTVGEHPPSSPPGALRRPWILQCAFIPVGFQTPCFPPIQSAWSFSFCRCICYPDTCMGSPNLPALLDIQESVRNFAQAVEHIQTAIARVLAHAWGDGRLFAYRGSARFSSGLFGSRSCSFFWREIQSSLSTGWRYGTKSPYVLALLKQIPREPRYWLALSRRGPSFYWRLPSIGCLIACRSFGARRKTSQCRESRASSRCANSAIAVLELILQSHHCQGSRWISQPWDSCRSRSQTFVCGAFQLLCLLRA